MRIAPLFCAAIAVASLSACGGGSDGPTTPTTPTTTLAAAPNFSGTYSGVSTFNVAGQAEVRPATRITVTHSGSTITFSDMLVTVAGSTISYPMGQAAQSGTSFAGTHTYQSQGCGVTAVQTTTRFAGSLMNIQATISPASCATSRIVAELSR